MNPGLLDLILFSEKRKDFLLLLKDRPMDIEEVLPKLEVSRTALLPQIKKLKEYNLVIQKDRIYSLSQIGEIIVEKMEPLVDTLDVFEKNEDLWKDRNLTSIPLPFLNRINELGDYHLIEPDLTHAFDINQEFKDQILNSNEVRVFVAYFHPQFPSFFLELAKKGTDLSLIMNESVFERFIDDFKSECAECMAQKNTRLFVLDKKVSEIPAIIANSDRITVLGLFNTAGRFDRQYVSSQDVKALKWGKELFIYYKDMARDLDSFSTIPS